MIALALLLERRGPEVGISILLSVFWLCHFRYLLIEMIFIALVIQNIGLLNQQGRKDLSNPS